MHALGIVDLKSRTSRPRRRAPLAWLQVPAGHSRTGPLGTWRARSSRIDLPWQSLGKPKVAPPRLRRPQVRRGPRGLSKLATRAPAARMFTPGANRATTQTAIATTPSTLQTTLIWSWWGSITTIKSSHRPLGTPSSHSLQMTSAVRLGVAGVWLEPKAAVDATSRVRGLGDD